MHYTSGTTGRPKGVTTGHLGRGTARAVFEDEAAVWHFDPTTCTWCARRCTTRSRSASRPGTLLSGGLAGHPQPLRRRRPRSTCCAATARPPPSWCRRTCSGSCSCPSLGADERFDSLRFLAHAGAPCPPSLKRATMAGSAPARSGSSTARPRASSPCARPTSGSSTPARSAGPVPGRRLSIAPVDEADDADEADDGDAGTIWCDMPAFARFSYWGDPEATAAAWRGDRPAPSVTSAGSMPTATSTSPAGATTSSSAAGSTCTRPRWRTSWPPCPASREVAVFGLPDEQWGQRVCAAYVRRPAARWRPRTPCGPPPRPTSPRTSGPRRTSPTPDLPAHRHRQAHAPRRARAPGPAASGGRTGRPRRG